MIRLLIINFLYVFFGCSMSDINRQEKYGVDPFVINPVFRINPKPANNAEIKINPPFFLIPLVNERKSFKDGIPEIKDPTFYSFRLSQDENFRSNKSITLIDSPWAIFNPHKKLENGTWYWQYKSNKSEWSETLKFQVSENMPVFETPTFEVGKEYTESFIRDFANSTNNNIIALGLGINNSTSLKSSGIHINLSENIHLWFVFSDYDVSGERIYKCVYYA